MNRMAESAPGPQGAEISEKARRSQSEGDMASEAPLTRGLRRLGNSLRNSFRTGPDEKEDRIVDSSTGTIGLTSEGNSAEDYSTVLPAHPETEASNRPQGEDGGQETVVPLNGIKPGMGEKVFQVRPNGFRIQVQTDSVPTNPSKEETSGPIKVSPLNDTIDFEGGELRGVTKVDCLPSGARFVAPLLFDFPVEAGDADNPIVDSYGKIRYEILIKDRGTRRWVRDPEGTIPLEIVKDDHGQTYVRAQIRHFSCWGLWQPKLDLGDQLFSQTKLPFVQRRKHQSVVKNVTGHDINIHIYAMRMSQWEAALESVKAGGGGGGFEAVFELSTDARENVNAIGKVPQMMTIPPGHSQWLEIPRVGAGLWSSRKAAVVIVTEEDSEGDGRTMRMEAVVHLRSSMLLEVKLQVKDGKVSGSPAAAGAGGILSQVMRVVQNQANATPGIPVSTVGPSRSEAPSALNDSSGGEESDHPTAPAEAIHGQRPGGGLMLGSPVMAESEGGDDSTPPRKAAAAGISGTHAAPGGAEGRAAQAPST